MLRKQPSHALPPQPDWYVDAIIYEIHVRAFADSNGDGIGDFAGLIERLDYLQDLGVTAIWLLPFYPSPLRDGGYDIADYGAVNSDYGDMKDFKRFLKEAHDRGIRVIIELVINHTSSEHPWFQKARRAAPGSRWRNFYVWNDSPEKYSDTRIIFQDFETSNWTWDPVAGAYYWHRFYSHQPDLNFDNPEVHKAVLKALEFWMDMGVDGLRLDAIPYLYEREGTNCENLPETHDFLKKLRGQIDERYADKMLLAEANQWPEDAAAYFGDGDECHMNFHFPLMPRMFMAVQLEDAFPIVDILEQTPALPDGCQWALFLRNHDELTLEMVTDEDRDYMYKVYAQDRQARINLGIRRRLAPLLKVRRKIELMNGLLMSLPGTPVLYYGDEIGMGDNIYLGDRDGVRTPMQWSGDRNAGFSRANPQKLYLPVIIDPEYHFESVNVEAQQNNGSSLLWWMKRLIALRKRYQVFGRGSIEFLRVDNPKILAFVRSLAHDDGTREDVLVVANLSRYPQPAELDLEEYAECVPLELFGRTEFPPVGSDPYLLTLGAHEFYWFALEKPEERHGDDSGLPEVEVWHDWRQFLDLASAEAILLKYLKPRRWFRGKSRKLRGASVVASFPLGDYQVVMLKVHYLEGEDETYLIPLGICTGEKATKLEEDAGFSAVARLRVIPKGAGKKATTSKSRGKSMPEHLLYDGLVDPEFGVELLRGLRQKRVVRGGDAEFRHLASSALRDELTGDLPRPELSMKEQTNSALLFEDRFMLKLFRKVEEGENPDVELTRMLTEAAPGLAPDLLGSIDLRAPGGAVMNCAIVQRYVLNQGTAWDYVVDGLERYYDRVLTKEVELQLPKDQPEHPLDAMSAEAPRVLDELVGAETALLTALAERTADMHKALAAGTTPALAPEPFTMLHQRSLYQAARTLAGQTFKALKSHLPRLPEKHRDLAKAVLERRSDIDARLKRITKSKLTSVRTRCHNDYHLGQVLFTGKDFVIIDFEGEPARPLSERRYRRSPLRDVAGMLRSFDYASAHALYAGGVRKEDQEPLSPWARLWSAGIQARYLETYLTACEGAAFLPSDAGQLRTLLDFYLLEKCVYELGYELNNRPDWVWIPLRGLERLTSED